MSNSSDKYSRTAISLHWIMAALLCLSLMFGLSLEDLPPAAKQEALMGHSALGIVILMLGVWRILHRRGHKPPEYPGSMSPLMAGLATFNTRLMYSLMLAQPTIGLLHGATYVAFDVMPFGAFNLTALVPSDQAVTSVFHTLHAICAFLLILAVVVHIGASLKHWLIDKDKVMQRILPFTKVDG